MTFRAITTLAALILSTSLVGCGGSSGSGGLPLSAASDAALGTPSSPAAPAAPSVPATSGGVSGGVATEASVSSVASSSAAAVASFTELAPSKAFALATVPEGFSYETLRTIAFEVEATDVHGQAIADTTLSVHGAKGVVFKGRTDAQGKLSGQFQVPSAAAEVRFELATIGINNEKTIALADSLSVAFGPFSN